MNLTFQIAIKKVHHTGTCTIRPFWIRRWKKYWQFLCYNFVTYVPILRIFFHIWPAKCIGFLLIIPHCVNGIRVRKRALERVELGWLSMASKMSNYRKISTTVDLTSVYRQVSNNNYTAPHEISSSSKLAKFWDFVVLN